MPKDEENRSEYEQGFRVDELMSVNVTGVVTARDSLVIDMNKKDLFNRISDFSNPNNSDDEIRHKYFLKDSRGWKLPDARKTISLFDHNQQIESIDYRPFDKRYIYYHSKMVDWGREKLMCHFLKNDNVGLVIGRQGQVVGNMSWNLAFISKNITDFNLYYRGGGLAFPLYLYPDQTELYGSIRTPNLAPKILEKISKSIKLEFEPEKSNDTQKFAPIDVLDYIYAVLHSPAYREKYKEFLKIDFPRVPYPENVEQFWKLVELGGNLRRLHLLEGIEPQQGIADFPIAGTNEIEKSQFVNTRVYINETQYFDHVPQEAWEFYIGGYQPAQKWLKDRKNRKLEFDDARHYQRVIRVLKETAEIMRKIE